MMKINGIELNTYEIKVRDENRDQLTTAKKELTDYLNKYFPVHGASNEHCVFIGADNELTRQKLSSIKEKEGFVIFTQNGDLFITGLNDTSTLYGTYYFIEKYLGVHWLSIDSEYFENKPVDVDQIDISYSFPFMLRYCHNHNGLNPVFRARNRCNYTVGDINDNPSYGGIRGIKYAFSWGLFGHTFEILLPYEKYYIDHPEYYSFAENHPGENHRYQICLTHPDVLNIVTKNALDYLDQHPGVKVISISQNDSYFDFEKNYCVCENCSKILEREGAYSGVLLHFVNQVADKIKEKYPDVLVHTFAYHFTENPPMHIKPNDNVVVQFCIHLPYGFRLDDDSPISQVEKAKIDVWSKISPNLFAWTYLINHADYFMPIGNIENIYFNTRYLASRGIKGIFQQENSDFNNFNFSELRAYLVSKLFNEPTLSYEEYLDCVKQFCLGYYGDENGYIFDYIRLLDEKYRWVNTSAFSNDDKIRFLGDIDFITRASAFISKAMKSVKEDVFKERIKKMSMQIKYCELFYLYKNIQGDEQTAAYEKKRKSFVKSVVGYGVKMYREGGLIPSIEQIDYSKAPDLYSKKDKIIDLEQRKETEWFHSGDCTVDHGGSFRFALKLIDENTLDVQVKVKGDHSCCMDNNILDWAQDCIEIYLSEDFNRSNKNLPNDYLFRINANGISYCRDQKKIQSVEAHKTKDGYHVHLIINLDQTLSHKKMGFEMMAHNFVDFNYVSTSYWNSFKGTAVYSAPQYYGILKHKE